MAEVDDRRTSLRPVWKTLPPRRIVACAIPVVYVWSLPALAHLRMYETENGKWVHFAHQCNGYPRCKEVLVGVSVASHIQTPQATGALAATFFYPLMHLWRPEAVVENDDIVFFTLLSFQLSFGILITCSQMLGHYELRELMQLIFCITAVSHYWRMLRHCHFHRLAICRVCLYCLIGAEIVLVAILLTFVLFSTDDYELNYRTWGSWTYFLFDAVGFSAIALFPLFWQRDRDLRFRDTVTPSFPIGSSFFSMGNSTHLLKVVGTICPVVYIWSLPWLATLGIFVHKCKEFPLCINEKGVATGESVSDMICTAPATGAMAACFFWPCIHFWMPGAQAPQSSIGNTFLLLFQVFFGCFLSCPVIYLPTLHALVVGAFCVSCITHLVLTLWNCWKERLCQCVAVLAVAISMLVALCGINLIRIFDSDFYRRGTLLPWCFYLCEAIGLTAIASFPLAWRRAGDEISFRFNWPTSFSRG